MHTTVLQKFHNKTMLKKFFNRFSKIVYAMEIVGAILIPANLYRIFTGSYSTSLIKLYLLWILSYLFVRFCATIRWHLTSERYSGIELHFKKIMVATSYVMAIFGLFHLIFPNIVWSIIPLVFFAINVSVNLTLAYFSLIDKDRTVANHYTHNLYK